jgi:hypothetical protein
MRRFKQYMCLSPSTFSTPHPLNCVGPVPNHSALFPSGFRFIPSYNTEPALIALQSFLLIHLFSIIACSASLHSLPPLQEHNSLVIMKYLQALPLAASFAAATMSVMSLAPQASGGPMTHTVSVASHNP